MHLVARGTPYVEGHLKANDHDTQVELARSVAERMLTQIGVERPLRGDQ